MVRTTHLEITSRDQWVRRARTGLDIEVRECVVKQPRFNRFLYEYVGGDWRWIDRLVWPARQWHDYAANALNNYLKSGFQIFKVEEKPG